MQKYDGKLTFPPPNKCVLIMCTLKKKPQTQINPYDLKHSERGFYLAYWTLENNELTWRDSSTNQQYYDVSIENWWHLEWK